MSYEVLSAEYCNAENTGIRLKTKGFGEVLLDPAEITEADRKQGRQHHNEAALKAYKEWLAKGNAPAPFVPPPTPEPTEQEVLIEAMRAELTKAKLDAARARLEAKDTARAR